MRQKSLVLIMGILLLTNCQKRKIPTVDYQAKMREFVIKIANHSRIVNPNFIVIPQNGARLVTCTGENDGDLALTYLDAIDGQGQEDLFYGYNNDDESSPADAQNEIIPFLDIAEANGVAVLTTDYCYTSSKMADAYAKNLVKNYSSFSAPDRNLQVVPNYPIHQENNADVHSLEDAKNFLYLIDPSANFGSKTDFVNSIDATNYDAFIIDFFYNESALTKTDLEILQTKPNGAKRLVISYMSIGEAEDYRFYWENDWHKKRKQPDWLYKENKDWEGNYKVFYWMSGWQCLIYGSSDAYLDRIVASGFDGVYLDIIDAFEYYEEIKE